MTKTLRFALAAPLALALAACGAGAEETGAIEGEAIAAIPAPEGTEWRSTATMTEDGGTLVGNPDAPLKLIEYGSLTCPTCARFSMEGGEPLLEYVDSGVVSFELRQFAIHGPLDLLLQRMTQCGPDEAVDLDTALRMHTINGAYASFEEDSKGSLEPGKLADLAVHGADLRQVSPTELRDLPIAMTWVEGELVYEAS